MKKKISWINFGIYLIFLLAANLLSAQQPQWYLKNVSAETSAIVDLRNDTPNLSIPDELESYHYNWKLSENSVWLPSNGELKLFISDDIVFDENGNELYRLTDSGLNPFETWILADYPSSYNLGIVRLPEDCDRWVILRYAYNRSSNRNLIHYYLFNSSTGFFEDFDGEIFTPEENPFLRGTLLFEHGHLGHKSSDILTRGLAISKMNGDGERYIFIEEEDFLHRATITHSSIEYDEAIFDFTSFYPSVSSASRISETEVISTLDGGYLYASTVWNNQIDEWGSIISTGLVLKINSDGNVVGNHSFYVEGVMKGLEFSPDGKYLYLTSSVNPYLYYIDLEEPTEVLPLTPSGPAIESASAYAYGSIEIAHNQKMYFAGTNGLSSLEDPNDPFSLWTNYEVSLDILGLHATLPISIERRKMIPLPDQVDGELLYTPIHPVSFLGCGSDLPTACAENYSGFEYRWVSPDLDLVLSMSPCFTPTTYGTYYLYVTDENGCKKKYEYVFKNNVPEVPEIKNIYWCNGLPISVGWPENPFPDRDDIEYAWTRNGSLLEGLDGYEVPYGGDGTYCVTVTVCDTIVERCFEVKRCCKPNMEFSVAWYAGDNLQTVKIKNEDTGHYVGGDIEQYFLYQDCNNDDTAGPWTLIHTSSRTSGFDSYIIFDDLNPDCFYKIVHAVTKDCLMKSFIHTEYVGGNPGIQSTISPNPTSNMTTVYIKDFDSSKNYQIAIYDMQGVKKLELSTNTEKTVLSLSQFETGLYFVKVFDGINTYTSKLLKQ